MFKLFNSLETHLNPLKSLKSYEYLKSSTIPKNSLLFLKSVQIFEIPGNVLK